MNNLVVTEVGRIALIDAEGWSVDWLDAEPLEDIPAGLLPDNHAQFSRGDWVEAQTERDPLRGYSLVRIHSITKIPKIKSPSEIQYGYPNQA